MALYKGFSYDDYSKPLDEVQKVHDTTLNDMANISATSDMLDFYLDPNDPENQESIAMYQNFKKNFNSFVDDFTKNGYNHSTGMKGLQLHRYYNDKITNILDSLKNKKTEEAAQMSAQEKNNGQMVFTRYANQTGVDRYLHGQMGYESQNLDEVHKFAKNEAEAASGREYTDNIANSVKALGNMYYHIRTQKGFDNRKAYEIIDGLMQDAENREKWNGFNNIDDKDSPLGFIRNMRAELQKRGIKNYSGEDQDKIIDAFLTGTYEGLKLDITNDFKDTPEMRAKGATRVSFGGNKYPETPYTPQSDKFYIQSDIEFDTDDINDAINWFLKPSSKKLRNDKSWQSMFVKNPDGYEGSYHLASEDEYNAQNPLNMDAYDYEERKKKRKEMYDNNIAFLKKYMQMDEIPSYYYKWGTNVAAELANY